MTDAPWIAALPMYDFPALERVHAALWTALRRQLTERGITSLPFELTRDLHHEAIWAHPRLLLGQACEYPLARSAATQVRIVAHPRYRVQGCVGATYRSAIVVRKDDAAEQLSDLRGRRCVINEPTSNSGMNLLRAAVAPLARGGRFFGRVQVSGSHRGSIEAVRTGMADVAAIDCVTLAHVGRFDTASIESLRILDWTPSSPSLPLITSAATPDEMLQQLRAALQALSVDPLAELWRDRLFLDGFELAPATAFTQVLELERSAAQHGYAQLDRLEG